jgi:hypothetical protein
MASLYHIQMTHNREMVSFFTTQSNLADRRVVMEDFALIFIPLLVPHL